MTSQAASGTPWYHHFWPWFIVILLGVSVLASLGTVYVAYTHRDTEILRTSPPAGADSDQSHDGG